MSKLYLIVAPSGVGKTTVVSRLIERSFELKLDWGRAVTATSRMPREGEVDGYDYHFYSVADFERKVKEGSFLEHASFAGSFYGTPRDSVSDVLGVGKDCLLVIDSQGATTLKESGDDCVWIQMLPPSLKELKNRLLLRGDSAQSIESRLSYFKDEMLASSQADYFVVNENIDETCEKIARLMRGERL